jgi:hypothetical protein
MKKTIVAAGKTAKPAGFGKIIDPAALLSEITK